MRTSRKTGAAFLLLTLTGAGIAACELKEARTATAPAPVDVPEDVYVSEHGYHIPIEKKNAFLKCVDEKKDEGKKYSWGSSEHRGENWEESECSDIWRPPLFTPDMTPDEAACVIKAMGRQVSTRWPDGRSGRCSRVAAERVAALERAVVAEWEWHYASEARARAYRANKSGRER